MVDTATKLPVKVEKSQGGRPTKMQGWRPVESLRGEIDRLFEDFQRDFLPSTFLQPFFGSPLLPQREMSWLAKPAVDVVETDTGYEVTAELPGMDEKNVEVKMSNGDLLIKGERQEEKEEKKKDYYLQERQYGSFERRFRVPEGVDADKVEASFKKGVLTVTLPKTVEAQKAEKKIAVKAA
jgi:HSP20 family protein